MTTEKRGKEIEEILGAVLSANGEEVNKLKQEVSDLKDLIQKMILGGVTPSAPNQTTTSSQPQQPVPPADSRNPEEVEWDNFFSNNSINDDERKEA
jgi:hypothetical protein